MTGAYRGDQQSHRLLGELLTNLQPLCRSECHVACAKLLCLFTIQLSPLSLIASSERRIRILGHHSILSLVTANSQTVDFNV
jgi:hypothetical protein